MYILDLILVYIAKYQYDKRKGVEETKLKNRALVFTLCALPVKIALIFLILGEYIPTRYQEEGKVNINNLTQNEWGLYSQGIWGLTLFYPVWQPPLYLATWLRSKDEYFAISHLMSEPKRLCLKSKWSDVKNCENYLYTISHTEKYLDEFVKGVDVYWTKNPERVCPMAEPFVRGFRQPILKMAYEKFPNRKDWKKRRNWKNAKGFDLYNKYYKKHLEYSAKEGCGGAAEQNLFQIIFGEEIEESWKGGGRSANYLLFICDSFKKECYDGWINSYEIKYKENLPLANKLHKEICSKHDNPFCAYPRDMSLTEFNKIPYPYGKR